jgi:NAD+ synthase (glutamine-hydrolysing)
MDTVIIRIACAQINCLVGDLEGNSRKIIRYINKAKKSGADIVCFPEMAVTGYPPEDLLYKPKFVEDNIKQLKILAKDIGDIIAIVGFVDRKKKHLYNSAAVIHNGIVKGVYHKSHLPNYGVFDEKRYFDPGEKVSIFKYGRSFFGVSICEDIWHKYGPVCEQAKNGAGLIININCSPYHAGKIKERERILKRQAINNNVAIAYTNLVGGQDELIFDGQSLVIDKGGGVSNRAKSFEEDLLFSDVEVPIKKPKRKSYLTVISDKPPRKIKPALKKIKMRPIGPVEEVYMALKLGLKDYVNKNGFKKVVIGLSGGVDSSVTAVLAVDCLGRDNVVGAFMPSMYTRSESAKDMGKLAENLNIKLLKFDINKIYENYIRILKPYFAGHKENATEENIQARIRGTMLMALSNKFGWLLLSTGNKSEVSVGYATLYGDMAGGFALLKDVPKTMVYRLADYINSIKPLIPDHIITKEPSAELSAGQKDTDVLPPYEILDSILKEYIEKERSSERIIEEGYPEKLINKILSMVDGNEYKRRQSPPGIKISPKAFGKDRRMPITNKYKK